MCARALSPSAPLTESTQAAFSHLETLVYQAADRHPGLVVLPRTGALLSLGREASTPASDLQEVAEALGRWAESHLALVERPLAGSIRHAATHLRTLAALQHGEEAVMKPPLGERGAASPLAEEGPWPMYPRLQGPGPTLSPGLHGPTWVR